MDFFTGLPVSKWFDAILVMVSCLTRMRHLILCNEPSRAPDIA